MAKPDVEFSVKDFYQYLMAEKHLLSDCNKRIDRELQNLLEKVIGETDVRKLESQRDRLFGTIAEGQEESFCLGFQYAVSILTINCSLRNENGISTEKDILIKMGR